MNLRRQKVNLLGYAVNQDFTDEDRATANPESELLIINEGQITMRAVCWQGTNKVQVETVPDPKILNPRDAIIKITTTAICGSDLHLYNGLNPTMKQGDIIGHEFMGEVVELGSKVTDVGLFKIPDGLTDEQVVFLTDIFPTGYMAAENCDIQPGDTDTFNPAISGN